MKDSDPSKEDLTVENEELRKKVAELSELVSRYSNQAQSIEKARTALEDEKAKSEAVLRGIGVGIIIQDLDYKVIYENELQQKLAGKHIGELCYKAYAHRDDLCPDCPMVYSIKDSGIYKVERTMPSHDGTVFLELTTSPLKDASRRIIGGIKVVKDITKYKRFEEEMRIKEAAISSTITPIAMTDMQGGITYANRSCLSLVELENEKEIIGRSAYEFVSDPEYLKRIIDRVISGGSAVGELSAKRRNGSLFDTQFSASLIYSATGLPLCIMWSFIDVTEQKLLEEQLRHAQKMEAIGTLTSGISHEFNNITTAIMGFAEFLRDEMPDDDPRRIYVDLILSSAERSAKLTHSLLAYSRKQITNLGDTSIQGVLESMEGYLRALAGENIVLKIMKPEKDISIFADKSQIEHVLINLAANAVDAMKGGGTLTLRAEMIDVGSDFVEHHETIRSGRYALLTVSDTGTGMSDEIMEKVFEPFFTTKDVGQGTGLGLSMSYGIVKRHNGFITAKSVIGYGSIFKVYIPLIESPESKESPAVETIAVVKHNERILVAEDDELVRKLVVRMLSKAGYQVTEASDGSDAVFKFGQMKDSVDLLLFDVAMPEINGIEAFEMIQRVKPDIKVVFMSGYIPGNEKIKKVLEEGHPLLSKPVTSKELYKKIREVLG